MKSTIVALLLLPMLIGGTGPAVSSDHSTKPVKSAYRDLEKGNTPQYSRSTDADESKGFDFGAGDRWSPYPPYHHPDK